MSNSDSVLKTNVSFTLLVKRFEKRRKRKYVLKLKIKFIN